MNCKGLVNFITRNQDCLYRRDVLLDLITVTNKRKVATTLFENSEQDTFISNENILYDDKLSPIVVVNNIVYGCVKIANNSTILYKIHDQIDTPIMDIYDEFELKKGMISNFTQDEPIITTYGRFILNFYILAKPFNNKIPYINDIFKYKSIQNDIARKILNKEISREEYDKYMNNIYFIGSFTELSVPAFTEKALTTSPEIIQRRDELFKKYKNQLDDPIIIAKIEDELISMDKAYLSDDPASGWIISSKEYDNARKKMFITSGVAEAFSDDSNEFTFIPGALNEAMDFTKLPAIANDIRRGSYMRGKETAKGGEETKFVLRIFQNVAITEDDCKTIDGIKVTLYPKDFVDYEGRTIISSTGEQILLTQENFSEFVGIPVILRSPMQCKAKSGFCYTCFGNRYRQLEYKSVGMRAVNVSSTLMQTAMKAMHKSKVSTVQIDNLDDFVI